MSPRDPLVLAGAALTIAAIALGAAVVPAFRDLFSYFITWNTHAVNLLNDRLDFTG